MSADTSFTSGTVTPADPAERWRVYRGQLRPRRRLAARGGVITFEQVSGAATLFIDGRQVAAKTAAAPGPLTATLSAGDTPRALVLIVEAAAEQTSGITGPVRVR